MNDGDPTTVPAGTLLDGRYRLAGMLGRGGFGVVYEAVQLSTGQQVAVKILDPTRLDADGSAGRAKALARFTREMEVVGRLKHPHIVGLIDAGTDRVPYVVFERVHGSTLADLIATQGALAPAIARRLMAQVLEALAYAHAAGVVHRDLKPGNIMVLGTGTHRSVKVLDFGIAGVFGDTDRDHPKLTATGAILGTVAYMAPERFAGERLLPQSDLYAWGLDLLECLTGKPFHDGRTVGELVRLHCDPAPLPLPFGLDPGLERIIARATAKSLSDRYASAAEALHDLDAWAPTVGALPFVTTVSDAAVVLPTTRHGGGHGRRRVLIAGGGVLAVVVAIAVGVVLGSGTPSDAPATGRLDVGGGLARAAVNDSAGGRETGSEVGSESATESDTASETKNIAGGAGATATPKVGVHALAAGRAATCALLHDGQVRCWGANQDGELGTGAALGDDVATPVRVPVDGVIAIAGAGGFWGTTFCALDRNGRARCWGANPGPGLIAAAEAAAQPGPIAATALADLRDLTAITLDGEGSGCVIAAGTPRCWGRGTNGVLGVGSELHATTAQPVLLPASVSRWDARAIACNTWHCCATNHPDAHLCWGANYEGQVLPGAGKTVPAPIALPATTAFVEVALEASNTCGRGRDGRVLCWGERYGKEADPVAIAGLEQASLIVAGPQHTCAIAQGHVLCWGRNGRGQLGDGTTRDMRKTATQVAGLDGAVGLALGLEHTCAIAADGGVACWGSNARGQLGDGTLVDRLRPVKVLHVGAPTLPAATNGFETAPQAPESPEAARPTECSKPRALTADLGAAVPLSAAYAIAIGTGFGWSPWVWRLEIAVADYRLAPSLASVRDDPRGAQLRVDILLERGDQKPIDRGRYTHDNKTRSARVTVVSRRGDSHVFGLPDELAVVVTHVSADWICGTVAARRGAAHLDGPFAARIFTHR